MSKPWDYLILTASNEAQAAVYRTQLAVRRDLGLLGRVGCVLVVADPEGQRIGSGASTLLCLMEVLQRELEGRLAAADPQAWLETLRPRRIFILHAGGDSRRLPAYGPCGKIFMPAPGRADSAVGPTLFDHQWPIYADLPPAPGDGGQIVIASGDVFLGFSPEEICFEPQGFTGLGCAAEPDQARRHGVYCAAPDGAVRRFLQKPSVAAQAAAGAIDRLGRTILDVGVVHFDAAAAVRLLQACEAELDSTGLFRFGQHVRNAVFEHGLDFYREICCGFGTEASWEGYLTAVREAGSGLDEWLLKRVFAQVAAIPSRVQVLRRCDFLHFGATDQLISSGQQLLHRQTGSLAARTYLTINHAQADSAEIRAKGAWIEGCRVNADLVLEEQNVVVGADLDEPLHLPARACLDLLPGRDRSGEPVVFVRCYHMTDRFNAAGLADSTFCGVPLAEFLQWAEARPEDVWQPSTRTEPQSLWHARLFPAVREPSEFRGWLWLLEPGRASARQWQAWREADRYSLAEMSVLADREAFLARRARLHGDAVVASLHGLFHQDSGFSAADIALLLAEPETGGPRLAKFLDEAYLASQRASGKDPSELFLPSRILYSLATAVEVVAGASEPTLQELFGGVGHSLPPKQAEWLASLGLEFSGGRSAWDWARQAKRKAFAHLQRAIVDSGEKPDVPRNALRSDEIVWGRSPVRLDLAGGWSDTPPYSLEHGGCVTNAAVMLNGQPPIQVYARVAPEPFVRIHSIDQGTDCEIRDWDALLDYGSPIGDFSLVKAALVLAGFDPTQGRSRGQSLEAFLEQFGGGLELTTLAAVPKGSGLGTSSIMGAVVLAVIQRVLGRELSSTELFHAVLRLEQALTTGGGWQDQIGGALGGVKLITTRPGLTPDPTVRYVPADVLDPKTNQGRTLLYYTGITRLAKNILAQVVGRYLDRHRGAMATLRRIRALAPQVAEALARKDLPAFGEAIDAAWRLNKELDPDSTNPQIEAILAQIRPHLFGAKLLGAGGGGFLLLVCRSAADAEAAKRQLETQPPNPRARFFDFEVSASGLAVSVS
jgi:fucokinase